jgi:ferric-dicitrate binding protein FerR (iron transport regulator)
VKARPEFSQKAGREILEFRRRSRVVPYTLIGIAAAALLVVGVSRMGAPDPLQYDAVVNGVGRVREFPLSDGTRVILGPASTLTIASDYAAGNRSVQLNGDGYFEVVHNASHPFSVTAGGATITDIGTKFTVHSHDSTFATVSVTEGSVKLAANQEQAVILQQGDRGHVKGSAAPTVERSAVTDDDIAWTRHTLVFRDTPLSEVREKLLRWYGIRFMVTDEDLGSRHLTATFTNETPAKVVEVIGLALGVDILLKEDTAFVSSSKRLTR